MDIVYAVDDGGASAAMGALCSQVSPGRVGPAV